MMMRATRLIFVLLAALLMAASSSFAGDATLTWDEPTTNSDGSPLTDLKGYRVYWGTAPGQHTINLDVARPSSCGTFPSVGKCQHKVTGLTDGVWYFAVSAYDTATPPNESMKSNEVSKTIATTPSAPRLSQVVAGPTTFEPVAVGEEKYKIISFSNTSDGPVTVQSVEISGDGGFRTTTALPKVVAVGDKVSFRIYFKPAVKGLQWSIVRVVTDRGYFELPISGIGA